MSIRIVTATCSGGHVHLEICPQWANGACACPPNALGQVIHPVHGIQQAPPPTIVKNSDGSLSATDSSQTVQAWLETFALDILRYYAAKALPAPPATAVAALAGLTL